MKKVRWGVWLRGFLLICTTLYAVVLVGDFGYSCWVSQKISAWEAEQDYDEENVRVGCQGYSRGLGEDAVLLVHGFNDCPRLWDFYVEELVDQGYHCRAMRLPGFAMPNEEYAKATLEDWVEAVREEADALRENHSRVHLVAHSLGSAISIDCEIQHPGTFDTLSLMAPLIAVSNARSPLLTTRQWQFVGRSLLVFTQSTYNLFPPDIRDPNAGDYPWRVPGTPRPVIAQTLQVSDRVRPLAGELNLPVMMVASEQDLVVDYDEARRFFEQVNSEKLWMAANESGHLIPIDQQRSEVVKAMVTFWKQAGDDTEVASEAPPKLDAKAQNTPATNPSN